LTFDTLAEPKIEKKKNICYNLLVINSFSII
jgi:hypothetical protein